MACLNEKWCLRHHFYLNVFSAKDWLFTRETPAELVYLPRGVDNFLLTGIERMAAGADFDMKIFACR